MYKEKLQNYGRTEVCWCEKVNGWGVKALTNFSKDEIIEETPFIVFPRYMDLGKNLYDMLRQTGFLSEKEKHISNLMDNLGFLNPHKYYFKWAPKVGSDGDPLYQLTIPLGNACLYNSSNCNNNIGWRTTEKTFIFKAERDIQAGEWLESFYGYFIANDSHAIYNCAQVFNLALDKDDNNRLLVKMLRFGDAGQFEQSKTNPSYAKLFQVLQSSKYGLILTRISGASLDGVERATQDFNEFMPMSFVYQKIFEFNQSNLPFVKINVKYVNKDNGQDVSDEIVFRK